MSLNDGAEGNLEVRARSFHGPVPGGGAGNLAGIILSFAGGLVQGQ
jgi:hypothetical protein